VKADAIGSDPAKRVIEHIDPKFGELAIGAHVHFRMPDGSAKRRRSGSSI
jgi:hypothetical protein